MVCFVPSVALADFPCRELAAELTRVSPSDLQVTGLLLEQMHDADCV